MPQPIIGKYEVFTAVHLNDLKQLKFWLENGTVPATIMQENYDGEKWTLAQKAIMKGNLEILKYLLKKEPSLLNTRTDPEYSAYQQGLLDLACQRGHLDIVKYLVEECNADIFEERLRSRRYHIHLNSNATNPIYEAARFGRAEILKYLIERGNVDVNAPVKPNTHRKDASEGIKYPKSLLFPIIPLSGAVVDRSVLEYLLKETNIDITVVDDNGDSVLFHIVTDTTSDTPLIQYLFNKYREKFDVNKKNSRGKTLLHYCRDTELTRYLVKKVGANTSIPDDVHQRTPLHYAIGHNHPGMAKCLINLGASVESEDKDGNTPLHVAAIGGHSGVCKVLVEHGASINSKNKKGDSSLHCVINGAFEKSSGWISGGGRAPQVFKYLIEHGANITQKNNEGKTAIEYLIARSYLKGLKYLIRRRMIDVNQQNERHESLVHLAAIYNQVPILDYLVRIKHANMNTRRFTLDTERNVYEMQSPLLTALSLHHYESSKYLMKHGASFSRDSYFIWSHEAHELRMQIAQELRSGRARRSVKPQSLPTHFQIQNLNNFNDRGQSVFRVANYSIQSAADPPFVHQITHNVPQFYGFLTLIHFLVMHIRGSLYPPELLLSSRRGSEDEMTIKDAVNTLPVFNDIH